MNLTIVNTIRIWADWYRKHPEDYEFAKKSAEPWINRYNAIARDIAKKNKRSPKLVAFSDFTK